MSNFAAEALNISADKAVVWLESKPPRALHRNQSQQHVKLPGSDFDCMGDRSMEFVVKSIGSAPLWR